MKDKIEVYGMPSMKGALQKVLGLLDITSDAIYVDMDSKDGKYSPREGLRLADRLAKENPDRKVMVYGFDSMQPLWLESNFKRVMAHQNARYIKAPFLITDLPGIYSDKKFENPALKAVADIDYEKSLVSKLKHDHHHTSLREDVLKRAREELGLSGNDEEVAEKLFAYEPKSKIEPQFFPGVFCDIEMTLLETFERTINKSLLKKLEEYSRLKPVNIWTGGDLKEIVPHLQKEKIEYPLLSKDWFNGCEVEIAIDDLSKEKFEEDYKIKSREYQQVNLDWLEEKK